MADLFDAGKPAPKRRGPRPKSPICTSLYKGKPCGCPMVTYGYVMGREPLPGEITLRCAGCGDEREGTPDEVAQATAADAAYWRKVAREERAARRKA